MENLTEDERKALRGSKFAPLPSSSRSQPRFVNFNFIWFSKHLQLTSTFFITSPYIHTFASYFITVFQVKVLFLVAWVGLGFAIQKGFQPICKNFWVSIYWNLFGDFVYFKSAIVVVFNSIIYNRLAHPGGPMKTNKAAALAKFLERKLQEPTGLSSINPKLVELALKNAKQTVKASKSCYPPAFFHFFLFILCMWINASAVIVLHHQSI